VRVGHTLTPDAGSLGATTPFPAVEHLRPAIGVVAARARERTPSSGRADRAIELRIGFHELVLIHKALEVVRTLEWLPRQDELLNDTLSLVDLALNDAV
jgi:hypothetical protein